jgi:hypothetical protein
MCGMVVSSGMLSKISFAQSYTCKKVHQSIFTNNGFEKLDYIKEICSPNKNDSFFLVTLGKNDLAIELKNYSYDCITLFNAKVNSIEPGLLGNYISIFSFEIHVTYRYTKLIYSECIKI